MGHMKRAPVKDTMLTLRISQEERDLLEICAREAKMPVGEYVRWCIDMGNVVGDEYDLVLKIKDRLTKALMDTMEAEFPVKRRKKKAG